MKKLALLLLLPFASLADPCITSSVGNSLCFAKPMVGEDFDANSWGELYLLRSGKKIPLTMEGRYFAIPGENSVSPSGNYINIASVEWGYLDDGKGSKEFVDRAYCNVIDMRSGCIISDETGSICSAEWLRDKDVMVTGNGNVTDILNFREHKPTAAFIARYPERPDRLSNLLRCDSVSNANIAIWVDVARMNPKSDGVRDAVLVWYGKMDQRYTVKKKAILYTQAADSADSIGYLVAGDKVRAITRSDNGRWLQIIYINARQKPLAAWVKAEELQ